MYAIQCFYAKNRKQSADKTKVYKKNLLEEYISAAGSHY
jgi:hypothetical protein